MKHELAVAKGGGWGPSAPGTPSLAATNELARHGVSDIDSAGCSGTFAVQVVGGEWPRGECVLNWMDIIDKTRSQGLTASATDVRRRMAVRSHLEECWSQEAGGRSGS